ncbi:MAG: polysaccharide biosynthesis/export family protein [Alphaproteobacteria bacterium]
MFKRFFILFFFSLILSPMGMTRANTIASLPSNTIISSPKSNAVEIEAEKNIPVFGTQLFNGHFADQQFSGFNPNYQISIGDKIVLKLWGAYKVDKTLTVDPKGNIFIPNVGPVRVLGITNQKLNKIIEQKVKGVYRQNVGVYAMLEAMQPVKVFVTGYAKNPGLYDGLSSDSILFFLDRAGGINPQSGSFTDIRVIRNGRDLKTLNLYDFLIKGTLPLMQFVDGDTIVISPIKNRITVSGTVDNAYQYEFLKKHITGEELLKLARVKPQATHAKIIRVAGQSKKSFYLTLDEFKRVILEAGDRVIIDSDKNKETISIRVEGEHIGDNEYILPYNASLGTLMERLMLNERSAVDSVQLFRNSVAKRQKEMIHMALNNLEKKVLNAKSVSQEEAKLRAQESQMLYKFIESAKKIKPKGQIILAEDDDENFAKNKLYLEDGDIIKIPAKNALIMTHGEVMFPNALMYSEDKRVRDYIKQSGGLTGNADDDNILVIHMSGVVENVSESYRPAQGDEILVMPDVDFKTFQLVKDVAQILYQIALTTRIVTLF